MNPSFEESTHQTDGGSRRYTDSPLALAKLVFNSSEPNNKGIKVQCTKKVFSLPKKAERKKVRHSENIN